MEGNNEPYTETTATIAKGEGTPGVRTVGRYCDEGLLPYILDANGRRLLQPKARELARQIYAERLQLRGHKKSRP